MLLKGADLGKDLGPILVLVAIISATTSVVFSFYLLLYARRIIAGNFPLARQSATIEIHANMEIATSLCIRALNQIDSGIQITKLSPIEISAITPIGLTGWGEKMFLKLTQKPNDKIEVLIESTPKLKHLKVDYPGKNLRNVEILVQALLNAQSSEYPQ